MHDHSMSRQRFAIISGLSGVVGVVLLIVSFAINTGPATGASSAQMTAFGQQHYDANLWVPGCRLSARYSSCRSPSPSSCWPVRRCDRPGGWPLWWLAAAGTLIMRAREVPFSEGLSSGAAVAGRRKAGRL